MRAGRLLILCLLLPLLPQISVAQPTTLSASSRPLLSMSISNQGTLTLSLGPRALANGNWSLQRRNGDALDADELAMGPIIRTEATQDAPHHGTVKHTYAAAVASYDYRLSGEDLRIDLRLQNNDPAKTIRKLKFA